MDVLDKLTRRQVDALQAVADTETGGKGAALKAIASKLGVSPPSALDHIGILEDLGLVERHRGKTRLTRTGRTTLVEYLRHHRIVERMLNKMGVPDDEICKEARAIDLAISHNAVERVCASEGHPSICPHGEPIPPCSSRKGER
jgi:DtxR family Mn-dependent transcriptional regulator